jgi:hypothetical protein
MATDVSEQDIFLIFKDQAVAVQEYCRTPSTDMLPPLPAYAAQYPQQQIPLHKKNTNIVQTIAGNEHAEALAKKRVKITQTDIR